MRHYLARFIFWQWKVMGKLSAIVYSWLYEKVNGDKS